MTETTENHSGPRISLAAILGALARETGELGDIAQSLDGIIPTLFASLSPDKHRHVDSLQRIDRLLQHLTEVSRALQLLSSSVDPTLQCDAARLAETARLEHFQCLFRLGTPDPTRRHRQGQVHLF